jgi:hypothetical protein
MEYLALVRDSVQDLVQVLVLALAQVLHRLLANSLLQLKDRMDQHLHIAWQLLLLVLLLLRHSWHTK